MGKRKDVYRGGMKKKLLVAIIIMVVGFSTNAFSYSFLQIPAFDGDYLNPNSGAYLETVTREFDPTGAQFPIRHSGSLPQIGPRSYLKSTLTGQTYQYGVGRKSDESACNLIFTCDRPGACWPCPSFLLSDIHKTDGLFPYGGEKTLPDIQMAGQVQRRSLHGKVIP
jgi:hypothetical protein